MAVALVSFAILCSGALWSWRRGGTDGLLVALVLALAVMTLSSRGHDATIHAFRIAALAEGLRAGDTAPLLAIGGVELPTFALYPTLAYLPPALLTLAGMPALLSLNLMLAGTAALTAIGARAAFATVGAADPAAPAALFLSASYVAANFVLRDAVSEALAVAFTPLILLALVRARPVALTVALGATIAAHPVLAPLTAALTGAMWLATGRILSLSTVTLCGIAALAVSAPVWVPPVMMMSAILGPDALPVSFAQSMVAPASLVAPWSFTTPGIALVGAAALALREPAARASVAAGAIFLALCLPLAAPLHHALPGADTILFVWRWMAPASLCLALAVALGPRLPRAWTLMAAVLVILPQLPAVMLPGQLPFEPTEETVARRLDRAGTSDWGMAEMLPDLSHLPRDCRLGDVTPMTALAGVGAAPVLRIPGGNPALLDIGTRRAASCDGDLVLAGEGAVTLSTGGPLLLARLAGVWALMLGLAALAAAFVAPLFRNRRPLGPGKTPN